MNRTYRVIWNSAAGTWQAVAETATGRGKRSSVAVAAGLALVATLVAGSAAAQVLPTGGRVVAGSGAISQAGGSLTVNQSSQRLGVDWQTFSIGQGNSVNFVQPSAGSVAMNRVLGSDVSVIQGAINANGQVFLLNPNGVLFTPTAQVNAGAIVASTLQMSTEDFMAGRYHLAGSSTAAVTNQGSLTATGGAQGGAVALVAARVVNSGSIRADGGAALLAAASDVTLDLGGPAQLQVNAGVLDALVDNGGAIRADGGRVYLTARAVDTLASAMVNNTGVVRAQTLASGEQGEIRLIADMKSGTANIGGTLDASAPNGGKGGNIETSGAQVNMAAGLVVDAGAAAGSGGTWLIDPTDYNISGASTQVNTPAYVISQALNSGTSVTVSTQASVANYGALGTTNGDITVSGSIAKTSGGDATLTLLADRNIAVNSSITSTAGKLNLTLSSANNPNSNLGGISINANLSSNGGDILIGGAGGNVAAAQTVRNGIGYALNSSASTPAIALNSSGANAVSISSGGGNITMNGYSTQVPSGSGDGAGIHIFAGGVVDSGYYSNGTGLAPTAGGNIVLSGYATSSGNNNQFGIKFDQNTGQSLYKTTVATSPVTGNIIVDGNNLANSQYAVGLSNAGNQGNLYFGAYATSDFLVLVNGNPSIAQFSATPPNSGCRVGYPYCGTFSVPGANGSYPDATFNAVVWSVNNIYVTGTVGGSKTYNGTTAATGLTGSNLSCSGPLAGCTQSSLAQNNLWSFSTSSPNAGSYKVLTPTSSSYTQSGTSYSLGYFFLSGSYGITPAPLGITVAANYNGTSTYSAAGSTIVANGLAATDQLTSVTVSNPNVAGNGSNYVIGLSGRTSNGTGTFLASNYTLNPGYSGTLSDNSTFGGTLASGVTPTTTTNSVWLTAATLAGITVHGTYNGTRTFSTAGGATIDAVGLLNGDVIDSVTVNSANVSSNGTNFVTSIASGHNGGTALTGNYVFNGSYNYLLADGSTFSATNLNGAPTTGGASNTDPARATNAVLIDPAPLGIALGAVYNGTNNFNIVNSAGTALFPVSNGTATAIYTNSGLPYGPTTAGTISVNGLVAGDTLSALTLDSAQASGTSAITGISGVAGRSGAVNLSNYVVYSVNQTPTNHASSSGGNILTDNNTAEIAKAALGINLNATYNGTTTYSSGVQSTGLLANDAITSVGINSSNVADNTSGNTGNFVNAITGTTAGGTDLLANYTIQAGPHGTPTANAPATTDTNTVTLAKAPLGINLNATYNGTASYSSVIGTNGLVGGDSATSVTLSATDVASNASNFITGVTGTLGRTGTTGYNLLGNYYISNGPSGTATSGTPSSNSDNTVTLAKAALAVTADDQSRFYGDGNPALSYRLTSGSLVNGDTLSGSLATSATPSSNVGSYGITQGTLANGNYVISFVDGALHITPRPLTVAADDQSKRQGAADPALTYRLVQGNLVGQDGLGALTRAPGEAPGSYVIDASVLSNTNYQITAIDGRLVITALDNKPALPPLPQLVAPIVVPNFADNAAQALGADTASAGFGSLNYINLGAAPQALPGSTPVGSAAPAAPAGSTPPAAPSAAAAVAAPQATADAAPARTSETARADAPGASQPGSAAPGALNFVEANADGSRKVASDLNVNNVTVPSANGPLDVFVVDTGVNRRGVQVLRDLGN